MKWIACAAIWITVGAVTVAGTVFLGEAGLAFGILLALPAVVTLVIVDSDG